MKNLQTLFALIACLSFFGCGNDTDSDLVPVIEVPGTSAKPMAYAKMIALPKLIQKAVEVVNAVKPGPESAMLPMIVGMALGDASLSSVNPNAPVTVFIFDDFKKGEPTFVLAMKLESDSPIKKQAETVGLKTTEEDGWTLATMSPDLFDEVTDWSSVLSFAEKDLEEDLEAGVLLDVFWNELPEIKDSIPQELGSSGMDSMLHLFLDEVANLDATKIELSLSAEEIMMRATVSAKEETELHALFSAEPKAFSFEGAKYVSGGGWMDALVNFDSASFLKYAEHVIGRINENTEDADAKKLTDGYLSIIRDGVKMYGGQMAMSYLLSGDGNPLSFVQVASIQASPAELKKLVSESVVLGQEMLSSMEIFDSMGLKYDFEFGETEQIDGVEVFQFGMKMEADGVHPELQTLVPYSNTSTFFAVHEGNYLAATSKDKLTQLLSALKSGKPVENNLAEQLSIGEGEVLSWRLDVVSYAQMVMSMVVVGENPLGEMMDGLLELKIPPITGKVSLGKGRLSSEMRIPVKSIKAGFDYFESATQAKFEEPGQIELEEPSIGLPEAEADLEREE